MILTNDGEWANRVLHPRYGNEREYARAHRSAAVRRNSRPPALGVELEDGPARLISAHRGPPPRESRGDGGRGTWLRVRIGEGRSARSAGSSRRSAATSSDSYASASAPSLAGLREGEWRPLRRSEVSALSGSRRR